MVWIARSTAPWRDLAERYDPWETVYSRSFKWIENSILDNSFPVLSLDAQLEELPLNASIVQAQPKVFAWPIAEIAVIGDEPAWQYTSLNCIM